MSVIFKALTRLERRPPGSEGARSAQDGPRRLLSGRRWFFMVLLPAVAVCVTGAVLIHKITDWPAAGMVMQATATAAVNDPAPSPGPVSGATRPEVVFQPAKTDDEVNASGRGRAVAIAAAEKNRPKRSGRLQIAANTPSGRASRIARSAGRKVALQSVSGKKDGDRSKWLARLAGQRKKTAVLVADVRNAMSRKDFAKADSLLGRLAALKGDDNLLVLQLRAYLMIQKGRWQEAESILNRILEVDPADREAALNLAVVQIKTGRIRQARRRLKQLYLRFPEDDRIGRWLDVLAH